jgi:hypothetical protein
MSVCHRSPSSRWRGLAVALAHEVGQVHVQFLRQVGERPELLGAGGSDVGGESVELGLWHGQF